MSLIKELAIKRCVDKYCRYKTNYMFYKYCPACGKKLAGGILNA